MAGDGRGFVLSWKGQMILFFGQQAYRVPNCTKPTQTHFSFSGGVCYSDGQTDRGSGCPVSLGRCEPRQFDLASWLIPQTC